jgi:hypothetical protein
MGLTFNGAVTYADSGSRVLNLFKAVGQRGADLSKEFDLATAEDKRLAIRTLLWTRDIRGGAGEREVARKILRHMEKNYQDDLVAILPYWAEYGRWDDLLVFETDFARNQAFKVIAAALNAKNGLCAKWMPRKGKDAVALRNYLGWSPKRYRKTLVTLTKVVETPMCAREWKGITYDHVPSVAAARYQKAFFKHDPEGYKAYRDGLVKINPETGKAERKINAGAVFPYDVLKSLNHGDRKVADAQWEALPNLLGDNKILPFIDLSSSMGSWSYYGQRNAVPGNVTPMDISVSIGLYTAGKQTGDFAGMWVGFSNVPRMNKLNGPLTLSNMYQQLDFADAYGGTNIEATFDLVLNHAIRYNVPQADLPNMILVVSDMEFNPQRAGLSDLAYNNAKSKFAAHGYDLPKVVFWHVNGRADNSPVKEDQNGTAMVSGFSPAIFKSILSNKLETFSPYNVMLETLNDKRYSIEGVTA